MEHKNYLEMVTEEIQEAQARVDNEQLWELASKLVETDRIFLIGMGRSGFMARAFSNRLMHLGKDVHFIGDSTTPAVRKGDALLIGSGSGETSSLVAMAAKARRLGAKVYLVTVSPNSSIAKIADYVVELPGASKLGNYSGVQTQQPMGNLFEQMSLLVYDSVVMAMMEIMNVNGEEMYARHANLE